MSASRRDVGRRKVDVLADHLRDRATAANFRALPVPYAVYEEEGFRAALDCDLLFACVDRPWGRYVLNFVAYAHLIPQGNSCGIPVTGPRPQNAGEI